LEKPEAAAAAAQTTRSRGFARSERRASLRRALGREACGGDEDGGEERAAGTRAAVAAMVGVGEKRGRIKRRR